MRLSDWSEGGGLALLSSRGTSHGTACARRLHHPNVRPRGWPRYRGSGRGEGLGSRTREHHGVRCSALSFSVLAGAVGCGCVGLRSECVRPPPAGSVLSVDARLVSVFGGRAWQGLCVPVRESVLFISTTRKSIIMKFSRCFRGLAQMLDTYSGYNPSPLSIKQFIDFGKSKSPRQCSPRFALSAVVLCCASFNVQLFIA